MYEKDLETKYNIFIKMLIKDYKENIKYLTEEDINNLIKADEIISQIMTKITNERTKAFLQKIKEESAKK